jgi:hypothetical protein
MSLLRAVLGLAGGHVIACAALHGSGADLQRMVGWSTPPVVVGAVAVVVLAAAGSLRRRPMLAPSGSGSLLGQLLVQGSLLAAVEAVEAAVGLAPLAGSGMLHDPVVWIGLVAQVVAALWVHAGARALEAVPPSRVPLGVPPAVADRSGPGREHAPHRLLLEAGSLVRRGPPIAMPAPARS